MYNFKIECKKIPVKINSNLSLYDACNKALAVDGGIVIEGRGRLVAFYCSYHKKIKAGFGALPYERSQIENFVLYAGLQAYFLVF